MRKLVFIITGIFISLSAWSQSFRTGFLFTPGLTIGGEYAPPAAVNDTTDFSLYKWRMQVTIPLKTKVKADIKWDDIKKLNFKTSDVKARQDFITVNYSQRRPSTGLLDPVQNIHTIGFGYTGLSAGIKQGIWLYSANLFLSESSSSLGSMQPNFLGYFARIKIKNLKFIYFYGAGLTANPYRVIPVPIAGFTNKLSKKFRLTVILPAQASLSCKISKTFGVDLSTTFSGFNALYRTEDNKTTNFRHLKSYLSFNMRVDKGLRASLETGYSWWRKLDFYDFHNDFVTQSIPSAPYISLNLKYAMGSSLFENKIEGVD